MIRVHYVVLGIRISDLRRYVRYVYESVGIGPGLRRITYGVDVFYSPTAAIYGVGQRLQTTLHFRLAQAVAIDMLDFLGDGYRDQLLDTALVPYAAPGHEPEAEFRQGPGFRRLIAAPGEREEGAEQRGGQEEGQQERYALAQRKEAGIQQESRYKCEYELPQGQGTQYVILSLYVLYEFICCHRTCSIAKSYILKGQMATPRLILCGSIALDRIMNFSGKYRDLIKPDKLHVLSLSVLLDKMEETPGGVAANIAYGLAQLGEQSILLGSVGPDAADYLARLKAAGIDTAQVHISKLPTASFNVMTDSEDNQVGGFYPGAMSDAGSLSLKSWAGQDAVVCVSAHDPKAMRAQVAECHKYDLPLIYDPGQQVSNSPADALKEGVETAQILIVNDYELGVLCDKVGMTPEAIKAQVPVVVTTLGRDGSRIEGSRVDAPVRIDACKPAAIVDPTGAGDAYRAGFLYGYLRQWQLPKCGRLGSATASYIIESHGTQTELSKEAVAERYARTFKEEIIL